MPRYARIHVTGGLFHVISRFHDRRHYLDLEGARETYLKFLGQAASQHDCRVVAYCLMSSHVHLVLQLGNDSLGKLTKKVHSPFSNWVNRRLEGVGAIFADRPKSVLVDSETYGLELLRYVHNNPVRAGVVGEAAESEWSSHRAYLGLAPAPAWLATEAVFGPDAGERERIRRDFASFVEEGRGEQRRPELSGEVTPALARRVRKLMGGELTFSYPVLGPDEFVVASLREQAIRHRDAEAGRTSEMSAGAIVDEVFEKLGMHPMLARQSVRTRRVARGRGLAAWLWCEKMGRRQVEIAEALHLRPSAVTKLLTRFRRDGLTTEEERVLGAAFESLTRSEAAKPLVEPTSTPKIIVLKRKRG